jgi:hypothetical protein
VRAALIGGGTAVASYTRPARVGRPAIKYAHRRCLALALANTRRGPGESSQAHSRRPIGLIGRPGNSFPHLSSEPNAAGRARTLTRRPTIFVSLAGRVCAASSPARNNASCWPQAVMGRRRTKLDLGSDRARRSKPRDGDAHSSGIDSPPRWPFCCVVFVSTRGRRRAEAPALRRRSLQAGQRSANSSGEHRPGPGPTHRADAGAPRQSTSSSSDAGADRSAHRRAYVIAAACPHTHTAIAGP